mmetsp:Transcript_41695/g.65076  ORF Transcript_41695/g.65076 Transcript_41695/m.65076 type:complete len:183 (+) Transcript_41695:448-996(+)|eukprot:CAMPEP_0184288942 /NCGR_PEP_ID=MMETSP1049-20130417/1449_1 /TAXON_ID=77928 /ORGANISM="Proteomonas sulcata, Strain CCMP704" /LENGTH=182 /DNA_ID=CAMNT_0026595565 /DNA_START=370 /DNA_END=918 /DNA_ORIENTATION=-
MDGTGATAVEEPWGDKVTAFTPLEDEKPQETAAAPPQEKLQDAEKTARTTEMSRASSASSLFHQQNSFTAIEKGDMGRHEPPSFLGLVRENIVVISFISFLLAFTLVCSLVEVMRLPICAFQVFCIGCVSVKWEEGSWLATEPKRGLRLSCQFLMLVIPILISALLLFIIMTPASEDEDARR